MRSACLRVGGPERIRGPRSTACTPFAVVSGIRETRATTEPVRLPQGPRIPQTVQGIASLIALCEVAPALGRRYGSRYTINLPIFGRTVVISDATLTKEIFAASSASSSHRGRIVSHCTSGGSHHL